jgi:NADH:ubiquinone oxidoreductase subunit 5 (subunit L)/multisubunit Na+/H+ antiporter MnhA subunit
LNKLLQLHPKRINMTRPLLLLVITTTLLGVVFITPPASSKNATEKTGSSAALVADREKAQELQAKIVAIHKDDPDTRKYFQ